jgi:two-component system cell cycle response regulator
VNAVAKARLLLVDDSMLMRKAASKMLGDEFDVATAKDGVEAWEMIQADTSIQVVFTDLSMPRMDGFALLQKVRGSEDEGTLNLPVIVVTGAENDEHARKKALDLGATDFITKPFGSVDLLARARAHSNYRRMARKLEQQSTIDSLTGLANKTGLLDRLQQDVALAYRHAQPLSLVRIEIDRFREVFLKHGKVAAETLVRHVGQHLRNTVRQEDTAARIGLASFALALPGGQYSGSKGMVERLRAQFAAEPVDIGGRMLPFSVSVGLLTPWLTASTGANDLLDACEKLLQAALQEGGNRVVGDTLRPPDNDAPSDLELRVVQAVTQLEAVPAPTAAPAEGGSALSGEVGAAAGVPAAVGPPSVDEALAQIERGESLVVIPRLAVLMKRLLPLFRLLNPRQRAQLVLILQKLGV